MTVSLRHSHEFKDYNLKKLYEILKTYVLEIQQDDEIEKSHRKEKTVALVANDKEDNKVIFSEAEVVPGAPNISV